MYAIAAVLAPNVERAANALFPPFASTTTLTVCIEPICTATMVGATVSKAITKLFVYASPFFPA